MLLGAHTSSAGGVSAALPRAAAIGATAMQIFTKTGNQWREPAIEAEERAAFRAGVAASRLEVTNSHDSYLINLASPDRVLWMRSLVSFVSELRRSAALGLDYVVSHPGNYIDDRHEGIARNAAAITIALETVPDSPALLLEMTAGSGTALGSGFEDMAMLLGVISAELQGRVGVCVDTAHVHAAGYDLAGDFDAVWSEFDDLIGLDRLRMLHLNDSAAALGSRRDRHALIGEGAIGEGAFRRIMTDDRFVRVPKIIETPKGDDPVANDSRMLALLRSFANPSSRST